MKLHGRAAWPLEKRLSEKIHKNTDAGCWLWVGAKQISGHGVVTVNKQTKRAHRVVYELYKGTIPKSLELDHLCKIPACVNPEHLEPVTHRENLLRGNTIASRNAKKTHCPRGHEYKGENLFIQRTGTRVCIKCRRDNQRKKFR